MVTLNRRKALAGLGLFAGVALIPGCAVNPVTGKREFMLMSEQEELSLGAEAHKQIVAEYGSYKDDSIQNWFSERGKEMSKVTHRKNLPYTFTVLDSPVINAFAVPGGYVYVTRGILSYFNDEAQFAGVLGHELGHVNARHSAARYSKAKLANLGMGIGSIFSEEFRRYSQLVSVGTTLLFLKFSRSNEREADKLGVEYSSAVDYNAVQMSVFFKTLERLHPSSGSLPTWQSTHPDPGDRVNATRKMSLAYQKKHSDRTFVVKREEYLDIIDGTVYGEDPRQGYVREGKFYHPEMKFQFSVPAGWELTNQPSEVRMTPEKKDALLIFTLAPGANPNEASLKFSNDNSVSVTNTQAISVNNMNGIHTSGTITSNNQTVAIFSYFIKMNEAVYAFHGLTSPADITTNEKLFYHSANGFDHITDNSLLEVSPKKIQIRKVSRKTTLKGALNGFGVPESEMNELAIINGLELTDVFEAGTRIKIIN